MIRLVDPVIPYSTVDAARRIQSGVPVEGWTPRQLQQLLDDVQAQYPDLSVDAAWRRFSDHPEAGSATLEIRSESIAGHYEIQLQPDLLGPALGYHVTTEGQMYSTALYDAEVLDPVPHPENGELWLTCPTPRDAVWACQQLIDAGVDEFTRNTADQLQTQVYARSAAIAVHDDTFVTALDHDPGVLDSPKAHAYARSAATAVGDIDFLNTHRDHATPGQTSTSSEADEAHAAASAAQPLHNRSVAAAVATPRPRTATVDFDRRRGPHR